MSAGIISYSIYARSRSEGKNAIAHGAYVAGEKLTQHYEATAHSAYTSGEKVEDEARQRTHQYARSDRVVYKEIFAPKERPEWLEKVIGDQNREELWNRVESAEKRKDAQVYREIILDIDRGLFVERPDGSLDLEASRKVQVKALQAHVKHSYTKHGMIADVAIHWDPKSPTANPHAHIMLPYREAVEEKQNLEEIKSHFKRAAVTQGFGNKNRSWNERQNAEASRENWATVQNFYLDFLDRNHRVDHRSYKRQGMDLEAEPKTWGLDKREKTTKEAQEYIERGRHAKSERAERLIENPDPLIVGLSQHFVGNVSSLEIEGYAARFATTADQQRRLTIALYQHKDLVWADDGTFTTTHKLAKESQRTLDPLKVEFSEEAAPDMGKQDDYYVQSLEQEIRDLEQKMKETEHIHHQAQHLQYREEREEKLRLLYEQPSVLMRVHEAEKKQINERAKRMQLSAIEANRAYVTYLKEKEEELTESALREKNEAEYKRITLELSLLQKELHHQPEYVPPKEIKEEKRTTPEPANDNSNKKQVRTESLRERLENRSQRSNAEAFREQQPLKEPLPKKATAAERSENELGKNGGTTSPEKNLGVDGNDSFKKWQERHNRFTKIEQKLDALYAKGLSDSKLVAESRQLAADLIQDTNNWEKFKGSAFNLEVRKIERQAKPLLKRKRSRETEREFDD